MSAPRPIALRQPERDISVGANAALARMLVSLPNPEIPSRAADHHGRPSSASATPAAISSRLGPSTSEPRTLKHKPNENSTPAQRAKLSQLFAGNHRRSSSASSSQHAM